MSAVADSPGARGHEPDRASETRTPLGAGRRLPDERAEPGAGSAAATGEAWAGLIERLVRGIGRSNRQWSAGRRQTSLQQVLTGSRSDLLRLHQRLSSLVTAWDADATSPTPDSQLSDLSAAPPASTAPAAPLPAAGDWPAAIDHLRLTVAAGLPSDDARAAELADRLAELADRLAEDGATPDALQALDAACADICRWFAHRHHLVQQAGRLCHELSASLADLAEDRSWARGQAEALRERLAEGLSARSVRAATALLAETRERHARVREERDGARDALKSLINRMLGEIGELSAHTGRFEDQVAQHARAIEAAESIESLAGVVQSLVGDSRAVRTLVHDAQARIEAEHRRARALEDQVRGLEAELRRLSDEVSTDALTRVANRRGLAQAFAIESARREREGDAAPLAVGLIDIDNFKRLNDHLGHAAGDRALQALAAAVRERLRPVDHLARFGGEEFVVLLPATGAEAAQQALSRLQRSMSAALFMHGESEVFVTFSAGVTEWRPGEALDAALERADQALYEAKRSGKNRTCRG